MMDKYKKILITGFYLGILFLPKLATATIAVSNYSNGSSNSINPLTFSHIITGSSTGLVVGISTHTTGGITHDSVSYNGVAMNKETEISYVGVNLKTSIWSLINPSVGTHDIVATLSGDSKVIGGAISFTGANQTDLINVVVISTSTGSVATQNITTITPNSIVVDTVTSVASDNQLPTVGTNQIERWNIKLDVGSYHGIGSTEMATTTRVVEMSWVFGGTPYHALAAVAVMNEEFSTTIASTTLNTPEEVFKFLSYDIVYSVIGFIILGVMASLWQHL